jgi:hypothetical protein
MSDLRQSVRYRNIAKTLSAIAQDYEGKPAVQASLLSLSKQYDEMADLMFRSAADQSRKHRSSVAE